MMSQPEQRISIAPILLVNFVGSLGFSIVLPFLVFLVTRWGGNALIYGLVGATYSIFQLIGAPILGRWSDTYGRRKILLLSQLGTLLSWVIFAIAFALPTTVLFDVDHTTLGSFALTLPLLVLFLARALDGITGGNISVASAYLADISVDETRAANFGKMAVSANLGFILGPALAGLLGATSRGELVPVLGAVAISIVASVLIATRLPESKKCLAPIPDRRNQVGRVLGQEHRDCIEPADGVAHSLREGFRRPEIPALLVVYFLVMLGFNFFYIAFPVHAAGSLQWSLRETGAFFAFLSLFMAVVQGPILGWATKKWTDRELALVGSLVLASSFPFFTNGSAAFIYGGAAILAVGNGLLWPSTVSMLAKAAGDEFQGTIQGFAGSVGAVASVLGLVLGGVLYESIGAGVFNISGGILFLVFWIFLAQRRPRRGAEVQRAAGASH